MSIMWPWKKKDAPTEKEIYRLFEIGVLLKGIEGVLELIGGVSFFFSSADYLNKIVSALTQNELSAEPNDYLTHLTVDWFHHLTAGTIHFVAFFLLVNGIINVTLVYGITRKKMWAYQGAIFILVLFVLFQAYRLFYVQSWFLILATVYDAALAGLISHEYKRVSKKKLFAFFKF